jgi:hypothetical protein
LHKSVAFVDRSRDCAPPPVVNPTKHISQGNISSALLALKEIDDDNIISSYSNHNKVNIVVFYFVYRFFYRFLYFFYYFVKKKAKDKGVWQTKH